jgi:DNA polymerase III delta prime subunit
VSAVGRSLAAHTIEYLHASELHLHQSGAVNIADESVGEPLPPFQKVDAAYLADQRSRPKRVFLARPPEWADVIHGADRDIKFIERDQTDSLRQLVVDDILNPLADGHAGRMRALLVTGPPGAGKTTIVRRIAAMLAEEERCIVADFGQNQAPIERDDFAAYSEALDSISQAGKPTLLVLDDFMYPGSGWSKFLHSISRFPSNRMAVLGAVPTYLYERYKHELSGRQLSLTTFTIQAPTLNERASLFHVHDRRLQELGGADNDFLAMSMEAAAGEDFGSIIDRIWSTLNGGLPIDSFSQPDILPWAVRAYLIACYFSRTGISCPEQVLRAALNVPSAAEPAPRELGFHLDTLVMSEGWHLFRIGLRPGPQPLVTVGASHMRIAEEAWRRRPAKAFDVADWIVPASVEESDTSAYLTGLLATTLCNSGSGDSRLLNKLKTAWIDAAARGVVGLRAVQNVTIGMGEHARRVPTFRDHLLVRARQCDEDSWLAVVGLRFISAENSRHRYIPPDLDLSKILKAAFFPEEQSPRVTEFLGVVIESRVDWKDLIATLLQNEQVAGKVGAAVWPRIITSAPAELIDQATPSLIMWTRSNPLDDTVPAALLKFMREREHPLLEELASELLDTLIRDGNLRITLAAAMFATVRKRGSPEFARRALQWGVALLERHLQDPSVLPFAVALAPAFNRVARDLRAAHVTSEIRLEMIRSREVIRSWAFWENTMYGVLPVLAKF